jgi:hypothetical protein
LFQRSPLKSETTFVNQLSILVHKCGLRFFARESEHCAKIDLKILLLHPRKGPSFFYLKVNCSLKLTNESQLFA